MNEVDREEVIYHGTTWEIAQYIEGKGEFEQREGETFFAARRELAEFFARRTCAKHPGGTPAIIKITVYAEDLARWKKNRMLISRGFDEGDRPDLRGHTQLAFKAEGIRFLNRDMLDWSIEQLEMRR